MQKIWYVSLGSALEAQLAVSGHWIVHENDVIGQFAIVQNFTMIFTQLATFCFKPELILKKERKKVILNIKYIHRYVKNNNGGTYTKGLNDTKHYPVLKDS